jgi:hypothetical protein
MDIRTGKAELVYDGGLLLQDASMRQSSLHVKCEPNRCLQPFVNLVYPALPSDALAEIAPCKFRKHHMNPRKE